MGPSLHLLWTSGAEVRGLILSKTIRRLATINLPEKAFQAYALGWPNEKNIIVIHGVDAADVPSIWIYSADEFGAELLRTFRSPYTGPLSVTRAAQKLVLVGPIQNDPSRVPVVASHQMSLRLQCDDPAPQSRGRDVGPPSTRR